MGNEAMIIVAVVGILALIIVAPILVNRLVNKASNKIEQKVKKGAHAEEQQMLGTVKHYKTMVSVSVIQAKLDQYVPFETEARKWNIMSGTTQYGIWKAAQNANQIQYHIQAKGSPDTVDAVITFSAENGATFGKFCFTQYKKSSGVTATLEYMHTLVRAVDQAFKAADPQVEVRTSQQKFN